MSEVGLEIKLTRYNFSALIGWAAFIFGMIAMAIQYFFSISEFDYLTGAIGLIGGVIAITNSDSLRTVIVRKVRGRSVPQDH